jgi:biopolymer transport protein ExbD
MVITPLTPYGLNATAPQPPPPNQPPPPPEKDPTVVIQIAKDGSMKINQEDVLPANLEARLIEIFKTRAQRLVFIKGDPDLDFETVATAIDKAKGAAIDKIGIMTPKIEQGL